MNQIARLRASFKIHKRSRSMDNSIKEPLYLNVNNDDYRKVSDSDVCKSSLTIKVKVSETPKKHGSFQKLKQELKRFKIDSDAVKNFFKKHKFVKYKKSKSKLLAADRSLSDAQLVEESCVQEVEEDKCDNLVANRKCSHSESSLDHIQFNHTEDSFKTKPEKPSFSNQLRRSFRKIVVRNKSFNRYQGFHNDNHSVYIENAS